MLLFLAHFSNGQNYIPFDTADVKDVEVLANFYDTHYNKIIKEVDLEIKKEKKDVIYSYKKQKEYFLDKIVNQSFILDSTINLYINSIFTNTLKANGLSADEYKILISKDDEVNAYNVGEGTIVIHYGLLNFVENEDQLVSVICHEIGHQILQHVRNHIFKSVQLINSDEFSAETKRISQKKFSKSKEAHNFIRMLNYNNFRNKRRNEIQADSMGFVLYQKTHRSKKEYLSVLRNLNDSDIERDTLTAELLKKVFDFPDYPFKEKWLQMEDNTGFNYDKDAYKFNMNIDSLKTHPSCLERIDILKNTFTGAFEVDDLTFGQQSRSEFAQWKVNSELQTLFNLFSLKEYGKSLYNSILFLMKQPENSGVKQLVASNMIELKNAKEKYKFNSFIGNIHPTENSMSQNIYINFMNNLRISEMEKLASHIITNH